MEMTPPACPCSFKRYICQEGIRDRREMSLKRIHVVAEGRVQGVGYRMFVTDVAHRYHVSGWVRNLPDGAVEAVLEGDETAVDAAVEAMHAREDYFIRVDKITRIREEPAGERGFEIRR
jgi:acylphosphatase